MSDGDAILFEALMKDVYITRTSSYLPNAPVSNSEIESVIGRLKRQPERVKQFVLANNGILTRYYAIDPKTGKKTHTNAKLASEAIETLLTDAAIPLEQIEGLACGTSSADQLIPSHANMVAGELGMAPAEIVSTAGVCASGMSAFKYAYMDVALGGARNFVVTGSECASAFMEVKQYEPLIDALHANPDAVPMVAFEKEFLRWMLSDGAGAVLLESEPRTGSVNFKVESVALRSWAGQLPVCMYAGMNKSKEGDLTFWFDEDDRSQIPQKGYLLLQQDARVLEAHMVDVAVQGLTYLIDEQGFDVDRVDWFLPHLSSMYFKDVLMEQFEANGVKLPEKKWFTNLADKGNTGSASIFIMLDELARSGRLQNGETVFCAVPESARFTMAGMLLTVC
jgi:3-oxoacyl-[acyl-carrier-protein] synthase-3